MLLLLLCNNFLSAQIGDFDTKKVIKEIGYYESGEVEYKSKTIRKGLDKSSGRIYGKQTIKLIEYFKNGEKELKEKKVIPRIVEKEHLTDERHILRQKKEFRKYKEWNKEGKKIEKGRYSQGGDKKVVKYNHLGHKKVIILFDKEEGRDVFIKKKPIYK